MKVLNSVLLGLILITLLTILYFQAFSRLKYETKIVSYGDSRLPAELSIDGYQGWQIVGNRRALDENKNGIYEIILQRKVVYNIWIN